MLLTIKNVEQFIFFDKKVQRLLPEFSETFHKWTKNMGKEALLDFLNNVTQEQLDKLSLHFGSPVSVQKLENNLIKNNVVHINKLSDYLNKNDFAGNVSIARDIDQIYVCIWR